MSESEDKCENGGDTKTSIKSDENGKSNGDNSTSYLQPGVEPEGPGGSKPSNDNGSSNIPADCETRLWIGNLDARLRE